MEKFNCFTGRTNYQTNEILENIINQCSNCKFIIMHRNIDDLIISFKRHKKVVIKNSSKKECLNLINKYYDNIIVFLMGSKILLN